jgi:hypothetical protein
MSVSRLFKSHNAEGWQTDFQPVGVGSSPTCGAILMDQNSLYGVIEWPVQPDKLYLLSAAGSIVGVRTASIVLGGNMKLIRRIGHWKYSNHLRVGIFDNGALYIAVEHLTAAGPVMHQVALSIEDCDALLEALDEYVTLKLDKQR